MRTTTTATAAAAALLSAALMTWYAMGTAGLDFLRLGIPQHYTAADLAWIVLQACAGVAFLAAAVDLGISAYLGVRPRSWLVIAAFTPPVLTLAAVLAMRTEGGWLMITDGGPAAASAVTRDWTVLFIALLVPLAATTVALPFLVRRWRAMARRGEP